MICGAYIARLDLAEPHLSGVALKIAAQRAALARAGLHTVLHTLHGGAVMAGDKTLRPATGSRIARRLTHYQHFWTETDRSLNDAAFLYVRFQGVGSGLLGLLTRFRARNPCAPILMEIPTWPYRDERSGVREHLLGIVDDLYAPRLKRYVDRIVTFSQRSEILGIRTICTQNGVDVAALPLVPQPPPSGLLRLVGVANLGVRHAYDRVIEGLAVYAHETGQRDIRFDIVGAGAQKPALEALVALRGLSDMVSFAGPLSGGALNSTVTRAHLGVAALGMHRIAAETSDLKSREYCARGLSFITANADADFPVSLPFVHHLPPNDDPVDIAAVVKWYRDLRDHDETYPAKLRAYAEAHLTWDAKMAPVIEWLRTQGAA
jgi:glycosyltransferase involved in cell wall biosynthesis